MEKVGVTVKFQELPNASPLSSNPPPPAFRARAFTTGSLWEIISRARSSPTHGLGRLWPGGNGGVLDHHRVDRHAKVITDYVHLERRHRQRHWSEFDAGGGRQRDDTSISHSPSATPVTGHCPNGASKPNIKYSRIPKPHEVQLRVDPKLTASKTNPNRNSLLINAYLSSSLHCLSKRRAQSAPTETDYADYSEVPEPFSPYWRSSTFTKGLTYLGDSLRSISRHRKSSIASNGSDPEDYAGRDDCLTPGGTFNVSSTSSLSVPSYRIAVLGPPGPRKQLLVDSFLTLGDADDDDVFFDEEGGEKSVFVMLEDGEYYLTFVDTNEKDFLGSLDTDAYVLPVDVTEGSLLTSERALTVLPNGGPLRACVILLASTKGPDPSTKDPDPPTKAPDPTKEDIAKLAVKHNGTLIELATNTVTMDTLESIIMQIKQMSADGEDPLPRHRTRKYHGLSMRDMSVDKQTLFNRFFRRTLSTKSCDNLLAL